MFVVGLTGGIGSGKSTVADLFVQRGVTLVDTDAIAHALTAPGGAAIPALQKAFGEHLLCANGGLDRVAMRRLVFTDASAKARLETILHPMIRAESDRLCAAAQSPYVVLAVPLLVESGTCRQRCDRILVVDCDEATQVARVMARNGMTESEVRSIIAAQATREVRLAAADDVVDNSGAPETLPAIVEKLHQTYLQSALTKVKANY
jgi:dephospho-CoA kinase